MMAMFFTGLFLAIAAFLAAFAARLRAFFWSFLDSFEFRPSTKNCFVSSLSLWKYSIIGITHGCQHSFKSRQAGRTGQDRTGQDR